MSLKFKRLGIYLWWIVISNSITNITAFEWIKTKDINYELDFVYPSLKILLNLIMILRSETRYSLEELISVVLVLGIYLIN